MTAERPRREIGGCHLCGLPSERDFCSYCTIEKKPSNETSKIEWPPSKDGLESLYNGTGMSVRDIARHVCRGYTTVQYWMRKYGIDRREREEAARTVVRKYPVRPFSSDGVEKAYLFGLVLGDLHAIKAHKCIVLSTSTSVPMMVELVTDSFIKYARPRIIPTYYIINGRPLGGWRIRFYLDLTFVFLLEKYDKNVPSWVLASDEKFKAFLAGVFDAEGHIGIYASGKGSGGVSTQLSVVNSNLNLISCLYNELRRWGYPVRVKTQESSGSKWHSLVLEQREPVQRLLATLPFRHPKKKAVARMILRLPPVLNAAGRREAIGTYKAMMESMKRHDREEGEASLAAFRIRFNDMIV